MRSDFMLQRFKDGHAIVISVARVVLVAVTVALAPAASAEDLKIGGAGPLIGTMEMLASAFNRQHAGARVEVAPRKDGKALSMGTKKGIENGIKGVYEGTPFIGFSSEHLNPAQIAAGGHEVEVARVALVFVMAAKSAPIDNITTQQVIDIYARKMREWRPGLPVRGGVIVSP